MSDQVKAAEEPLRWGDIVIGVVLLLTFVGAYAFAQEWPFRARFFPQLLSIGGMIFGVLKLIGYGLQWRRSRHPIAVAAAEEERKVGDTALVSEEQEEDQSLEYVFATAGGEAWARALGWVFGFFILLWLVGVFIAVPVFALLYLLIEGKVGWLAAGLYAVVAGGILYVAFARMLSVPMPQGILFN